MPSAEEASLLRAALAAYEAGSLHLAFDLYKRLADEGHCESQVFVGWMLTEGVGCLRNDTLAAQYYERAATLGNPVGSFYFGRWLTKRGEHERAFRFYGLGAKSEHLPSMFRVGYSFARGKGTDRNMPRAYAVLKTAAARGHAYALREMAIQDLKGGRGPLGRLLGVLEFLSALGWGVAVSMFDKNSDLIRG